MKNRTLPHLVVFAIAACTLVPSRLQADTVYGFQTPVVAD